MAGFNLPPGVSVADIDRHANGGTCKCGHSEADHGPDEPFDRACLEYECDCEAYEEAYQDEPDYEDEGEEEDIYW